VEVISKNRTIPLDGMHDFELTIDDFGFEKITSASLTDCASDCKHFPLDGIKTRTAELHEQLSSACTNQIIPPDGIKTAIAITFYIRSGYL
jgi:hypothetical protein